MQDLNVNPKLPFEDNSFDVITNVVCICLSVSFTILSTYNRISASGIMLLELIITGCVYMRKSDNQDYIKELSFCVVV